MELRHTNRLFSAGIKRARTTFAWLMAPIREPEPRETREWSLPTRIVFRLAFLYFLFYIFCNGNVTILLLAPGGLWLQRELTLPFAALAQIIAIRVIHLSGLAVQWHGGGSGDTTLDYIRVFCFAMAAVIGTILWSAVDYRRPHYRDLHVWIRFLTRLTLGLALLDYGFSKLFPLQMQPPSLALLNETYGQSSPMTLLWMLIGSSPGYEMVCGFAEIAGGFFVLFRRTALFGALLSAFVLSNVVLYNFFFDVPVKLFASHLLLLALFLVLPDVPSLWSFFVLHQPSRPKGVWVPPTSRRISKIAIATFEAAFLVWATFAVAYTTGEGWKEYDYEASLVSSPLIGIWQLDSIEPPNSPLVLTGEGHPWTELCLDSVTRAFVRSTDGQLWRCEVVYDERKRTLGLYYVGHGKTFSWNLVDADHLQLKSVVSNKKGHPAEQSVVLLLHRIPVPTTYPLLTRGFHWINEWGYER